MYDTIVKQPYCTCVCMDNIICSWMAKTNQHTGNYRKMPVSGVPTLVMFKQSDAYNAFTMSRLEL